ncbi:MAG: RHS repeat-associated core domain-containing protein [Candidatus Promineifilaceae bacterium]
MYWPQAHGDHRRGYTGHKHNNLGANDLELIYMNARFYVPAVGRFASADALAPDPANPQQFNRYSYVLNSPLNFTDPTGYRECDIEGLDCGGNNTAPDNNSPHPGLPTYPDEPETLASIPLTFVPPLQPLPARPGTSFGLQADGRFHEGFDYPQPAWTPVYSPSLGVVVVNDPCALSDCVDQAGVLVPSDNDGYGNLVIIEYPHAALPQDTIELLGLRPNQSLYVLNAHLIEPSTLAEGTVVDPGTGVGNVGSTGNSTGNHLHIELRIGESRSLWSDSLCAARCGGFGAWRIWDDLSLVNPDVIW